ncbi:MAG: hypothetical protein ACREUT_19590 [Steroidobacteraceae bacterium]
MSASQYEVFENPIPRARRAFPFVSILQSDLADTGSDRIVAPLVPRLVPMTAADLRTAKDSLTTYRDEIVAALDLLFLDV